MSSRTGAPSASTTSERYTERLVRLESVWWKRLLDVQAPYRWNLRRLVRGHVLEVGCGVGRNLRSLPEGSAGVDHNPHSVRVCRERGMSAFVPDEIEAAFARESFGTLLFSHVLEHLPYGAARALVREHLTYLVKGGHVVMIVPQEKGFASDPTHVEFFDSAKLRALAEELGLTTARQYSFPLPAAFGRVFTHNELVSVARK